MGIRFLDPEFYPNEDKVLLNQRKNGERTVDLLYCGLPLVLFFAEKCALALFVFVRGKRIFAFLSVRKETFFNQKHGVVIN